MSKKINIKDIREITIKLFPHAEERRLYLELFVEAITYANSHGSNKWGIHCRFDGIRLLMGHLIVFTLHKGRAWFALDKKLLESSKEYQLQLTQSNSWQWDTIYSEYKRPPSRNGYCDFSTGNYLEIIHIVKGLHFNYLDNVAASEPCLRKRSQNTHNVAVLAFLRNELGVFVPEAVYHQTQPENNFILPEEIMDNETFVEGSKIQITVNAYERNPKARQACITHHGTRCLVCGFDFGEKYGEIGKGVIHVHHLKPISNIGQKYKIDPIHDLIPVCPNCHTIIHKKNPPYTIDEIKELMCNTK